MEKGFGFNDLSGEYANLIRQAFSDPEFIKGMMADLAQEEKQNDKNENMITKMIEGNLHEVIGYMQTANDFIETSEVYDDFREEIVKVIENFLYEFFAIATEVSKAVYENSNELDNFKAKRLHRQYLAYKAAGFDETQAFMLINQKNDKNPNDDILNNFIRKIANDLNKNNKK